MGGVLHTINPRLFPDQLEYIANHAEDRVLLYDRAFTPLVEMMKPRWKTIEHYICFDPRPRAKRVSPSGSRMRRRLSLGRRRRARALRPLLHLRHDRQPKGVLYEHRSTMLHTMASLTPDVFNLSSAVGRAADRPDVPCQCLGHSVGGAGERRKLVLSADYRPERMCGCSARKGHSLGRVPTIWLTMIEYIERTGEDLGHLSQVTIGGSAAPRAMIRWFRERGIDIGHAWGMTETSPIGTSRAKPADWDSLSDEEQLELVAKQGKAPFGIELRVVDDEGKELAARRRLVGPAPGARALGGEALLQGRRGLDRRRPGSIPATSQ
jgi:acyl-CoA synthetase (AMP-forming)/AMP-acid ligase II